ncbi:hypothetical protein BOS5A_230812 [Bosea sp. EC-HK365B]|nr:hypothetical protein BOSE21B_90889 [Bosea sp. 21B]VVT61535.1 hypothetical protein BOS5A_230812 [Bosea sp. EC-HK365B]VXB11260.1 hypothetical protein BOSE127_100275 [Bosea sp. 127]
MTGHSGDCAQLCFQAQAPSLIAADERSNFRRNRIMQNGPAAFV